MFEGNDMAKCNKYVKFAEESKNMWRLKQVIIKPNVNQQLEWSHTVLYTNFMNQNCNKMLPAK
jgi:hypothetical protein